MKLQRCGDMQSSDIRRQSDRQELLGNACAVSGALAQPAIHVRSVYGALRQHTPVIAPNTAFQLTAARARSWLF